MPTILDIKPLYHKAVQALSNVANSTSPDFRFEQAEYDEKKKFWKIVVSYLEPNTNVSTQPPHMTPWYDLPYERVYREVWINDKEEIVKVKIFNAQR
ncbi:hypothetical protein [Rhodoflexus caldus]|uniref:hypothetical protein n=1 Tax=Rhodoflexus caldus TaxID=2891236 RepID=UPI00202AADA6|nr:hypothetical protein [Rhodoflexus caldus]